MTTKINPTEPGDKNMQVKYQGGAADTVYAIGIFGAWAFYTVYELLEFLHKE